MFKHDKSQHDSKCCLIAYKRQHTKLQHRIPGHYTASSIHRTVQKLAYNLYTSPDMHTTHYDWN